MHVNFAVQLIKKGIIYGKQFFDFYYNNISGTVFSTADWLVRVDFSAGLENMREDYTPICWQQARIIENIVTGVCPQSHVLLIDKTQDFKNELAGWVNKDTVYTPYSM